MIAVGVKRIKHFADVLRLSANIDHWIFIVDQPVMLSLSRRRRRCSRTTASVPRRWTRARGGSFAEMSERPDTPYAWRRGRSWRVWTPDDAPQAGSRQVVPDLEDAVVVAALRKREGVPV